MTLDFATQPGMVCVTMKQNIDDILATCGVKLMHPTPAAADLFEVNPDSPKLLATQESYYRTYVAKLLYLAKRVRPDMLMTVSFLTTRAQFCTDQDMSKLHRVLGYLLRTPKRGIVLDVGPNPQVHAFVDAAYGIHAKDGKSHTGAFIVFGRAGPIYVTSVKQSIVTKSSTEAELVAVSDVASEVISLRNYVIAQGQPGPPAVIYQDNSASMSLIDNGAPCSKRSRHIDIRYFWISDKVKDGNITIVRRPTETMWANVLTKPVQGAQFDRERDGLTNWQAFYHANAPAAQ